MQRLKPYAQASDVLPIVRPFLSQSPIILEAGSFNGSDTVKMAQFWPQSIIHTFEPVQELYEDVKNNTKAYKNIVPYCKALSDRTGSSLFYISEHIDQPGRVWGCGSLLQPKEHLTFDQFVYFPCERIVEAVSLDDWAKEQEIETLEFLWLDMQGSELHVLKESQLAKRATAIFTEVEFVEAYASQYLYKDVKKWMRENGFKAHAADFDEDQIEFYVQNRMRYYGNVLYIKWGQ